MSVDVHVAPLKASGRRSVDLEDVAAITNPDIDLVLLGTPKESPVRVTL